jgi:hypothetical protein
MSGRPRVLNSASRPAVLILCHHDLTQSFQTDFGLLPQIRPRPLPHNSEFITDSALYHLTLYNRELLKGSLNKPNVTLRMSYRFQDSAGETGSLGSAL